MKRRGFLGMIGGVAVAGPAMAKQAVQSIGTEAMVLPSIGHGGIEGGYASAAAGIAYDSEYDHAQWLRDRIAQVAGISDAEKRERAANAYVSSLDADLAANRSFSLSAKIEMQKRRNVERELARDHKSLSRELADYLKRQLLS